MSSPVAKSSADRANQQPPRELAARGTQAVADSSATRTNQQPVPVPPLRRLVALADSQRGLVTLLQLLGVGFSVSAVERLVINGFLTRIHQGVFAIGRASLDTRARWLAATLAAGPGALLSHLCAGGLWRVWPEPLGMAHVVLEGNGRRGHAEIAMHRMRVMHPDDAAILEGIPVTSLELTCLHLATKLGRRSYERSVIKAARRREFSVDRALELCDRSHGRPGVERFRAVVARDLVAELRALSELELRFIEILRECQFEMPEVNHDVERCMVDAVWEQRRVIVELDGFEFHKLPRDLRVDNERGRRLVLAGWRVIRFTWADLTGDRGRVADSVRALLALERAS